MNMALNHSSAGGKLKSRLDRRFVSFKARNLAQQFGDMAGAYAG
jgi:hypothetical protein